MAATPDLMRDRGLLERFDLRFDLCESSLKRGAPGGVRCPLRQDIFPLQVQRLLLAFADCPLLLCEAPSLFIYDAVSGVHNRTFPGIRHLFLH